MSLAFDAESRAWENEQRRIHLQGHGEIPDGAIFPLETMIREYLADTVAHCIFKRAWIPAGWACVEIETAAKELAEKIGGATHAAEG
jgi:hypothetical protein